MAELVKNTLIPSSIKFSVILPYMRMHRYLAAAVLSWFMIAGLIFLGYIPLIQKINDTSAQIADQTQMFNTVKSQVDFLQALSPDQLKNQLSVLNATLPSVKPVLPLITSIQNIAVQSGLNYGALELSPGKVSTSSAQSTLEVPQKSAFPGVYSLPLTFTIEGDFPSMNQYFKALDGSVPLLNVNSIAFAVSAQTQGVTRFKATVDLEALYIQPIPSTTSLTLTPFSLSDNQLVASLSAEIASQQLMNQSVSASPSAFSRPNVFVY